MKMYINLDKDSEELKRGRQQKCMLWVRLSEEPWRDASNSTTRYIFEEK